MPPFSLPAFRLRGWGWGLSLLGMAPGRWPACCHLQTALNDLLCPGAGAQKKS